MSSMLNRVIWLTGYAPQPGKKGGPNAPKKLPLKRRLLWNSSIMYISQLIISPQSTQVKNMQVKGTLTIHTLLHMRSTSSPAQPVEGIYEKRKGSKYELNGNHLIFATVSIKYFRKNKSKWYLNIIVISCTIRCFLSTVKWLFL